MEGKRNRAGEAPETSVVYSLRPFIGALAWEYLQTARSPITICTEIAAERGELYEYALQISRLPGGEVAAALLSKERDQYTDDYARLRDNGRIFARNNTDERTRYLSYKMYRLHIIESATDEDTLTKARHGDQISIGRMAADAVAADDRVAQVFWGYILSIFSPPGGIRTTPVFDSIVCYQIAKCAYETDSVPLLTSGWSGEREGGMRTAHLELVEYYKRVALYARRAIDTWTMAATRCDLVYDVRHLIVQQLWEARHAWAGSGVPPSKVTNKKICI